MQHRRLLATRSGPFVLDSEVRSYCRSIPATNINAGSRWPADATERRHIDFLAESSALKYSYDDPDTIEEIVRYPRGIGLHRNGELASSMCKRVYENGLIIEAAGSHGEVTQVPAQLTTVDTVLAKELLLLSRSIEETVRKKTAS